MISVSLSCVSGSFSYDLEAKALSARCFCFLWRSQSEKLLVSEIWGLNGPCQNIGGRLIGGGDRRLSFSGK